MVLSINFSALKHTVMILNTGEEALFICLLIAGSLPPTETADSTVRLLLSFRNIVLYMPWPLCQTAGRHQGAAGASAFAAQIAAGHLAGSHILLHRSALFLY